MMINLIPPSNKTPPLTVVSKVTYQQLGFGFTMLCKSTHSIEKGINICNILNSMVTSKTERFGFQPSGIEENKNETTETTKATIKTGLWFNKPWQGHFFKPWNTRKTLAFTTKFAWNSLVSNIGTDNKLQNLIELTHLVIYNHLKKHVFYTYLL